MTVAKASGQTLAQTPWQADAGLPTQPAVQAHTAANEPSLTSDDLLQGRKTIAISHNGTLYRLQATRLGKLILTK